MAKKAKISQEELRRMMNKEKLKQSKTAQTIDSPLARYTKDGSVICIICNAAINRQLTWSEHISSKGHRDKIFLAKEKKLLTIELRPGKEIGDLKRPSDSCFKEPTAKKPKGILKNAPPLPPSVSEVAPPSPPNASEVAPPPPPPNANKIPAVSASSSTSAVVFRGESVPEGFFDDPVMDAKARNIEYRDPQEEEWERFLKEMKEESSTSAQIIAEDQEEATTVRTIEEMDEQLRRWGRVMELVKKKEEVQTIERKAVEDEDEEMPEDSEDFDEFLDWRSKKSYR